MNVRSIAVATALTLTAATGFADQLYHPSNAEEGVSLQPQHLKRGLSRAEVDASVMGAQRAGTLSWISRGYPATYPLVAGPALKNSREQVDRELRDWQAKPVTADGLRFVAGELGWVEASQVP